MSELREDNTENNCTVESDPPNKTGRPHYWRWESGTSDYRICTTCGRREFNGKGVRNHIHNGESNKA